MNRCQHLTGGFKSIPFDPRSDVQYMNTVADPGFPVGGGGANLQRGHFSAKMYAKTKELDLVGGARTGGAP